MQNCLAYMSGNLLRPMAFEKSGKGGGLKKRRDLLNFCLEGRSLSDRGLDTKGAR